MSLPPNTIRVGDGEGLKAAPEYHLADGAATVVDMKVQLRGLAAAQTSRESSTIKWVSAIAEACKAQSVYYSVVKNDQHAPPLFNYLFIRNFNINSEMFEFCSRTRARLQLCFSAAEEPEEPWSGQLHRQQASL